MNGPKSGRTICAIFKASEWAVQLSFKYMSHVSAPFLCGFVNNSRPSALDGSVAQVLHRGTLEKKSACWHMSVLT